MKLFIAGDSIQAHNDITRFPLTGIGAGLMLYLKHEIKIYNYARHGMSTKSYIEKGVFSLIEQEIGSGDMLFIQFGHNDEKAFDESRFTEPFGSFKENLITMVDAARKVDAIPVLITPLERRCFENASPPWNPDTGADVNRLGPGGHADYVEGMKQVAQEEQVALIDLYTLSRKKMEEAGPVETTKWFMHLRKEEYPAYPNGLVDNTHLKPEGAIVFAGLIAQELKKLGGQYAEILVDGF